MTASGTVRVSVDRVEAELRKLWDAQGPTALRARTMTVVALCETPEHLPIAERALAHAAPLHGARAVIVDWRQGEASETPAITAEVSLMDGERGPSGERVRLVAIGEARAWIPDTVAQLITADLPVFVWWVGDLPDHETLFKRMAFGAQATVAVVNANDMDLRDLAVLDTMAHHHEPTSATIALADFTWHRLRTWQELTARFFDNPVCENDLPNVRSMRLQFKQRGREPEVASNQAALFAGWLSSRMHLELEGWQGATAKMRGPNGEVRITFEGVERPDTGVHDGALLEVELRSDTARYRVHRDEHDPFVVCWEGECPGTPFPNQCVRVHPPDDPTLLARVLERPTRDALYEASLHTATRIVAPIAPPRG